MYHNPHLENPCDYVGLGFLPLIAGAASTDIGQNIIGGTVDTVGDFFGGLFGDTHVDRARAVMGGELPCGRPYNAADLRLALEVAPRGTFVAGDPTGSIGQLGTIEGAQAAVRYGHSMFTCCSLGGRGLANALAFVANGKYDCETTGKDLPARNHADTLLSNYNRQLAENVGAPTAGWDPGMQYEPAPLTFAGPGAATPLIVLGALGLVGAMMFRRR